MTFTRYVAVGDSTTEGLDDPDGNGGYRGWADRLAERLASLEPAFEYANLAVRGRLTREIREQQLAPALAMEPNLVTAVAGMNDLIRPSFDIPAVIADIEAMHREFVAAGATVLTFTLPAPGPGMPLAGLLKPRVARFNRALRASAKRTGTCVLDLGGVPVASDPRLWSQDRLHANSLGHERIEEGLAWTLGLPGATERWKEPLPLLPRTPFARALVSDLSWARTHMVPWVFRHLRGESSGDDREPKRPVPGPFVVGVPSGNASPADDE